jgi:tRNA isopentenyl-2-thiomethyl-A-37 hydroxylase MiaE
VQRPDTTVRESNPDRETLEQQVRTLQERLAFYEGFDRLIQDNVAHARELFRLAAQEREAASTAVDQARHYASRREAHLRGELELIASDLRQLSQIVETLADRVARALGEQPSQNGRQNSALVEEPAEQPVSVVVHGVPSAREALSLQRFVASLPQVADVSAREFVGGVLRLDARVRDRLRVGQFQTWGNAWGIEALTERPDVLELVLREPVRSPVGA